MSDPSHFCFNSSDLEKHHLPRKSRQCREGYLRYYIFHCRLWNKWHKMSYFYRFLSKMHFTVAWITQVDSGAWISVMLWSLFVSFAHTHDNNLWFSHARLLIPLHNKKKTFTGKSRSGRAPDVTSFSVEETDSFTSSSPSNYVNVLCLLFRVTVILVFCSKYVKLHIP